MSIGTAETSRLLYAKLVWMPMLVFEVTLALWLIVKGVAMPTTNQEI